MVVAFDIETTGLNPLKNVVILIGVKKGKQLIQWKIWEYGSEDEIILEFVKYIENVDPYDEVIIGYNALKFDLSFIVQRLNILGKMSTKIWGILFNRKWLDLYQILGNDFRSFNSWLKRLGIRRTYEDITGKDIPFLYKLGCHDEIAKKNADDLDTLLALYRALLKVFPPEILPRHDP